MREGTGQGEGGSGQGEGGSRKARGASSEPRLSLERLAASSAAASLAFAASSAARRSSRLSSAPRICARRLSLSAAAYSSALGEGSAEGSEGAANHPLRGRLAHRDARLGHLLLHALRRLRSGALLLAPAADRALRRGDACRKAPRRFAPACASARARRGLSASADVDVVLSRTWWSEEM